MGIIKKIILISVFLIFVPVYIMAADKIPVKVGLLANKANFLIQHNKINQAVSLLEKFSKENKAENTYYIDFLLGNCFLMLDQNMADKSGTRAKGDQYIIKAAMSYENTVRKNSDFSPAWANLAKCRYDLEQMGKAGKAFIKTYETSKEKKPDPLYYASTCYFLNKNYKKALNIFNKLIKNHPDKIKLEWKETFVNIFFSLNRYKQALPWIKQLAASLKGKKKKKWQEILLYQYMSLNMPGKALEFANFLTKTDPVEPKWWKALTHIYLNQDNYDKGLESLIIYSFLKPLSQQETCLMADLYLSCNVPLKAAEFYQKWLNKEIENSPGKKKKFDHIYGKIKRISNAYMQGFQNENALKWIDKGLKLKNDPILLKIKADILYEQKQYKLALAVYKKLSKFKKYKGKALLMMGYSAWNHNKIKIAANCFKRASKFSNQKKSALRALQHLKNMENSCETL